MSWALFFSIHIVRVAAKFYIVLFCCFEVTHAPSLLTLCKCFFLLPSPKLQMQMPDVRVNHNVPPRQTWVPPPQGFPASGGGGPAFAPNHQYMPPAHHYDNYYPPANLPPMDKQFHQGPPPAFARDASTGIHSSSAQPQQSVVTKVSSFA